MFQKTLLRIPWGSLYVLDSFPTSCFSAFGSNGPSFIYCIGDSVEKFSSKGVFISSIITASRGPDGIEIFPENMVVDSFDNVYVTDASSNQIFVLAPNTTYTTPSTEATIRLQTREFKYLHQNYTHNSSFRSFNNHSSLLKHPNKSVMPMDEGEKEDFLCNNLEKMAIHLRNWKTVFLRNYFSLHLVMILKKKLSAIIITALESHNPIKVIQENLTHYNGQYCGNIM